MSELLGSKTQGALLDDCPEDTKQSNPSLVMSVSSCILATSENSYSSISFFVPVAILLVAKVLKVECYKG